MSKSLLVEALTEFSPLGFVGGGSVEQEGFEQASVTKQPHTPPPQVHISDGKHSPQQHSSPTLQLRPSSKPAQELDGSGGDDGQVSEPGVGGAGVRGTPPVGGAGVRGTPPVGGAGV